VELSGPWQCPTPCRSNPPSPSTKSVRSTVRA
jgi:hypothetical protein